MKPREERMKERVNSLSKLFDSPLGRRTDPREIARLFAEQIVNAEEAVDIQVRHFTDSPLFGGLVIEPCVLVGSRMGVKPVRRIMQGAE